MLRSGFYTEVAPRVSARLSAKATAQEVASTTPPNAITKVQATAKRPKKKQKTSANAAASAPRQDDFRKIKGKRGQLKTMAELPLDVLLEIFGHLHPRDLLSISWATKALRNLLTGGSTTSLWTEAYKAIKSPSRSAPPPCPPEINIIHYTNFMFGQHCNFCAAPKASVQHWVARVRLCTKCAIKELAQTPSGIIAYVKNNPIEANNVDVAHSLSNSCYIPKSSYLGHGDYYLTREFSIHLRGLNQYGAGPERERYIAECLRKQQETLGFSKRVRHWFKSQQYSLRVEKDLLKRQRREAIIAKLREEGYGPELAAYRYHVERLPGGNIAAELTDKEWERIKPRVIGVYEYQRQQKRENDMVNTYQKRMRYLHRMLQESGLSIHAPAPYITRLEPFSLVMKDIKDSNEASIEKELNSLASLLPDISTNWTAEADKFLLSLFSSKDGSATSKKKSALDRMSLDLASTFFACNCKCKEPITYPRILMHRCLRGKKAPRINKDDEASEEDIICPGDENGSDDDPVKDADFGNDGGIYGIPTVTPERIWNKMSTWAALPWNANGDDIWVDEEATGYAKAIIRACGEDPETVTSATMNGRTDGVQCLRCIPPVGTKTKRPTRRIMTWTAAILHDIEFHSEHDTTGADWCLVTDAEGLALIRESEARRIACNQLGTSPLDISMMRRRIW